MQSAVLLLALLAIGYAVRAAMHDPLGVNQRVPYVCVASGRVFNLSPDEAGMVPAPNPHTGKHTLLPCAVGDDGRLYVGQRYRPVLIEGLADINKHVDPVTLAVN